MLLPAAFTLRGLTWAALEQRAARPAAAAKGGGAAAAAAAAGDGAQVAATPAEAPPRLRSRFEARGVFTSVTEPCDALKGL